MQAGSYTLFLALDMQGGHRYISKACAGLLQNTTHTTSGHALEEPKLGCLRLESDPLGWHGL